MPDLLTGKTALVLGVANKWSLAYAIVQAYVREGANVILTYQSERQKDAAAQLAADAGGGTAVLPCDVTAPGQVDSLMAAVYKSWLLTVELKHGHHRYAFLVDGVLTLDPRAQGVTRNDKGERVSLVPVS